MFGQHMARGLAQRTDIAFEQCGEFAVHHGAAQLIAICAACSVIDSPPSADIDSCAMMEILEPTSVMPSVSIRTELPPTCSRIDWPALIVLLPAETVIV